MSAPGAAALDGIDRVLSQRPHKDDHGLAAATERLAEFRETLIAGHATTGSAADREHLAHVNAILSVVVGMHFPLGDAPWDELQKARTWLARILDARSEHG